jgi:N-acetylglutamate synthase-like GNAT family acetyltransferase
MSGDRFTGRGRGVLGAALVPIVAALLTLAIGPSAQSSGGPAHAPGGVSEARFERPPGDSKPTMLWFWNGTITEQLVDTQLAEMRDEGIEEAVIFPDATTTLRPVFFSEEWFAMVDHALREAKRTGMKIWLFNDRQFPSGLANGIVANGGKVGDREYAPHPELRAQSVARSEVAVGGPGPVDIRGRFPGLTPSSLTVSDGRMAVDGGYITLLNRGGEWTDYTLSFDTRPLQTATLSGHSYAQAGWISRAPDAQNGYVYLLGNYPHAGTTGGNLTRITYKNGANTGTKVIDLPFDVVGGRSYHVETRVEGTRRVVTIDGTVVDDVTDATYPRGTIGFREATRQNESATFDNLRVTAPDGTTLYQQDFSSRSAISDFAIAAPPEDVVGVAALPVRDGEPDIGGLVDLTDRFRSGGSWDAPAGDHVLEYYVKHATDFAGPSYLNLLDPAAIDRYIEVIHDEYYRRFAWAFEEGLIPGFWDDEPRIAAAYGPEPPWSELVERRLAAAGTTPARTLAAVFDDHGTAGRRPTGEYWRAVGDAFAEAYYKPQGEWAAAHGTRFISNPWGDDRLPQRMYREAGEIHKNNQWAQIPGGDAIFGRVAPGKHNLSPRHITSDARQQGSSRILHENLGGYGWGVTPQLARYVNGAMGVRGVNLTILHAFWSNPASVRYPPPLQPANPWWGSMDALVESTGRIMELARGEAATPTALLHPQTAAESLQKRPAGDVLDAGFNTVAFAMEDQQVDYDIVDEASMNGDPAMRRQAVARGGELQVGEQAYRLVVVPPTPIMSVEAVTRLEDLVRGGGRVIAYGELPTEEPKGRDAELRDALARLFATDGATRVTDTSGLAQALDAAQAPAAQLAPADPDVRVLRLRHGHDRVFLLMNEGTAPVSTTATLPAAGTPEIWDPDDGSHRVATRFEGSQRDGSTALPLELAPAQTVAVVFRGDEHGRPQAAHLTSSPFEAESVRDAGPQTITARVVADRAGDFPLTGAKGPRTYLGTAHAKGSFAPIAVGGTWRFRFDRAGTAFSERPLGSWTQLDPAYSGTATYQKDVDLDAADLAPGRRLILDLGAVRDTAHVTVNGTPAGRLLWEPYRVDITGALRAGTNTIEVQVANTPANEHGEAQASGLLGPVALHRLQVLDVELTQRRGAPADAR